MLSSILEFINEDEKENSWWLIIWNRFFRQSTSTLSHESSVQKLYQSVFEPKRTGFWKILDWIRPATWRSTKHRVVVEESECRRRLKKSMIGQLMISKENHGGVTSNFIWELVQVDPNVLAEIALLVKDRSESEIYCKNKILWCDCNSKALWPDSVYLRWVRWVKKLYQISQRGDQKDVYEIIKNIKEKGFWKGKQRAIMFEMLLADGVNMEKVESLIIKMGQSELWGEVEDSGIDEPNADPEIKLVSRLMIGGVWDEFAREMTNVICSEDRRRVQRLVSSMADLKQANIWSSEQGREQCRAIFEMLKEESSYDGYYSMPDVVAKLIIELNNVGLWHHSLLKSWHDARKVFVDIEKLKKADLWPGTRGSSRKVLLDMSLNWRATRGMRVVFTQSVIDLIKKMNESELWDKYAPTISEKMRTGDLEENKIKGILRNMEKLEDEKVWSNENRSALCEVVGEILLETPHIDMCRTTNLLKKLDEDGLLDKYAKHFLNVLHQSPLKAKTILKGIEELERVDLWRGINGPAHREIMFELLLQKSYTDVSEIIALIKKLHDANLWNDYAQEVASVCNGSMRAKEMLDDLISLERAMLWPGTFAQRRSLFEMTLRSSQSVFVDEVISLIIKLNQAGLWDEFKSEIIRFSHEDLSRIRRISRIVAKLETAGLWVGYEQCRMLFQMLLTAPQQEEQLTSVLIVCYQTDLLVEVCNKINKLIENHPEVAKCSYQILCDLFSATEVSAIIQDTSDPVIRKAKLRSLVDAVFKSVKESDLYPEQLQRGLHQLYVLPNVIESTIFQAFLQLSARYHEQRSDIATAWCDLQELEKCKAPQQDEKHDHDEAYDHKKYWDALLIVFKCGGGKLLLTRLQMFYQDKILFNDLIIVAMLLECTFDAIEKLKILEQFYPQGMDEKTESQLKKVLNKRDHPAIHLTSMQLRRVHRLSFLDQEQLQVASKGLESSVSDPEMDPQLKASILYELAHMHLESNIDNNKESKQEDMSVPDSYHELQTYGLLAYAGYCLDCKSSQEQLEAAMTRFSKKDQTLVREGIRHASQWSGLNSEEKQILVAKVKEFDPGGIFPQEYCQMRKQAESAQQHGFFGWEATLARGGKLVGLDHDTSQANDCHSSLSI